MKQPKVCQNCPKIISDNVAWYSLRVFGKNLCIACQILAKRGLLEKPEKVEPTISDWAKFDREEWRCVTNFEAIF